MSWMLAAGAAISIGSSMLSGKSAKKAQQQQEELKNRMAMEKLSQQQKDYVFNQNLAEQSKGMFGTKQANVDTGFASTSIDPATGQVRSTLNAPWAAQRDMFMNNATAASGQGTNAFGRADQFFKQAGDFNPQTFAADRYRAGQALLQPGRQSQQQNLMQDLLNKGGYGLTVNQAAAPSADANGNVIPGTGVVGTNPFVSTFMNANNQADAQMGYGSLREGQDYLDAILRRGGDALNQGGSMFNLAGSQSGFGQNIESQNQNALNQAGMWTDRFTNQNTFDQERYLKMLIGNQQGLSNSVTGYYDRIAGVNNPGAGANNRAQQIQGAGDTISSMFTGSFGNKLAGLGGGTGPDFRGPTTGTEIQPFGGGSTMFPNNFGVGMGGGGF